MSYQRYSQQDISRHTAPARSIDYLKIRLHRMVVSVMKQELEAAPSCSAAKMLIAKEKPILIKGTWLALFGMCFAIFVYQLYDRISYYYTYPVAVDVSITQPAVLQFPELTICYPGVTKFLNPKEYISCNNEIASYMINMLPDEKPVDEIWKEVNTSTGLIAAHEIKGNLMLPLKHEDQPLIWGTCTTFRSSNTKTTATGNHYFNITLESPSYCNWTKPVIVYIHDSDEGPMSRNVIALNVKKNGEVTMTKRQFVFVNRTDNICITSIKRQECTDDCLIKVIIKMEADKCRFPYYPQKMNNISKHCVTTGEITFQWMMLYQYLLGVFDGYTCHCPRKCVHNAFSEWIKTGENIVDTWTFILRFGSPYETVIKERLSYDLLNLFCDVGGNSGLFIGISLLSFFQLGHTALRSWKRRCLPKTNQFSVKDPLYRKVIKTYNNLDKEGNEKYQLTKKAKQPNVVVILKRLVVFLCSGLLIALSGNRLYFYIQYPMETIVLIAFNTSFEAPVLILCFGDENVMKLQREFAKLENISNPCDVNVWELFSLPNITATDIWPNTNVNLKINSFLQSYDLVRLYDGSCYTLSEENIIVPSNAKRQHYLNVSGQCGTGFVKAYIKSPTGSIDYHRYAILSDNTRHTIKYLFKEIHFEESGVPCITREENEYCVQNCLHRKLFNVINCRLPYMPEADLPLCRSSSSVRHAHLTFRELFFIPNNAKDCYCLPKCQTRIIETVHQTFETEIDELSVLYAAQDIIVESYVAIYSYSFVKLLCDIGGLLGAILGFCILDIIEIAVLLFPTNVRKPMRS